jgi:hypothetical protein
LQLERFLGWRVHPDVDLLPRRQNDGHRLRVDRPDLPYFIVDGILMIILAIAHRRELSGKWEWILVNRVLDLILAGIIISGLPGTLFWALGLLVGIDMVFGGASLIAVALEARKEATFT